MPKGKHHGGGPAKKKERAVRAALKRERKAGAYLSPGDPDFKSFSNQLAVQGLKLRDVPGDGNCLFRALSAQLGERLIDHQTLRRDVVHYMKEHKEEFEPFLEDGVTFDEHISDLSKDGEYAGNDAIVAFARCHGAHVVIHQHNAPRWEVHAGPKDKTLHIAYLNGEHYCSVETLIPQDHLPQLRGESPVSPPLPPLSEPVGGETSLEARRVLEATGCKDLELVEQSLCENSYDPELAIVEILQLMSIRELGPGAVESSASGHKPGPANARQPQSLQGDSRDIQVPRQVPSKKTPLPQSGRHLSNRERKAEAKAARKQRRKEASTGKSQPESQLKEDPVGSMSI